MPCRRGELWPIQMKSAKCCSNQQMELKDANKLHKQLSKCMMFRPNQQEDSEMVGQKTAESLVVVSCHRFTNLREICQGDLSRKLVIGLTSNVFEPPPCNCKTRAIVVCGCNNMCRNSIAVCKVKCNNTRRADTGNTQQTFKAGMQQHFNEVQKLVKLSLKLDSHAKHFATDIIQ